MTYPREFLKRLRSATRLCMTIFFGIMVDGDKFAHKFAARVTEKFIERENENEQTDSKTV